LLLDRRKQEDNVRSGSAAAHIISFFASGPVSG